MLLKKKLDPRAKRSRAWMRKALMDLIAEKDYGKITITDITERAGLSRPTFYLHYKSKDEILIDYLESLFDPIMEQFNASRKNAEVDQPGALAMISMFKAIEDNIEAFRTVSQTGAEKLLMQSMVQRNMDYLCDLSQRCGREVPLEVMTLAAQFQAGAFVGLIINWIQSEDRFPAEQMGLFLNEATVSLLRFSICNDGLDYIFVEK